MERNEDIDYAINANRWALIFCGLWPYHEIQNPPRLFSKIMSILLYILSANIYLSQFTALYEVLGNRDELIDNLTYSLVIPFMQLKSIVGRMQLDKFRTLYLQLYTDWHEVSLNKKNENDSEIFEKRKIMRAYAKSGRYLCIGLTIMMYATAAFFFAEPIYYLIVERRTNIAERYFPYPSSYGTDLMKETPFFEVLSWMQIIGGNFCLTANYATDSSITVTLLHLCGQLEVLANAWRDLFKITGNDKKLINYQVQELVKRHLHLIKLAKLVENTFTMIIFLQLMISSILIALIGFNFVQSLQKSDFLQFSLMISYMISQSLFVFLYCYSGQKLRDQSIAISTGIYMSNWDDMLTSHVGNDFIIVMMRSQRQLGITAANLYTMDYSMFMNILKTAGSYVSILRAMY
ncbi:Odorant receptor 56 [Cephus cinctus]|nr:Odorant receptor 56 [Cephus cinctus]